MIRRLHLCAKETIAENKYFCFSKLLGTEQNLTYCYCAMHIITTKTKDIKIKKEQTKFVPFLSSSALLV